MKVQQAYFSESNKTGGWQLIGYLAPSGAKASETTNFKYKPGGLAVGNSTSLKNATVIGLQAENIANLNECQAGTNWQISMSESTDAAKGADVVFTATANAGGNNAGCIALTPTFDKIGK